MRWQHPEHGLIPPGAFVQTVEQTGLIGPLTRHVLERSIAECAAWRKDGREMSVAVNLSVRNLLDRDLPKEIERLLTTYWPAAGGAPARDHREHDHVRPRAGAGHGDPARAASARACRSTTSAPATRRWPTCATADRRAQDRPLVRLADAAQRERPDHRALHDQPRPRPRAQRDRRGRRGQPDARRSSPCWAAISPRATTSAGRCRPTPSTTGSRETAPQPAKDATPKASAGQERPGLGHARRRRPRRPHLRRSRAVARPRSRRGLPGRWAPAAPGTPGRRSARR